MGGSHFDVDATGEDGRGTLFVAYAGWRHWVLGAWKLPTENTEAILPCLRAVVRDFGLPLAIVRDLGRAMTPAVDLLRQDLPVPVPVLACHLHFLRDIGTDLLKPDYQRLRALFRDLGVRPRLGALVRDLGRQLGSQVPDLRGEVRRRFEQQTPLPSGPAGLAVVRALAQWVLDYGHDGRHRGFPFERPYLDFYRRCLQVGLATARLRPQPAVIAKWRSPLIGCTTPSPRPGLRWPSASWPAAWRPAAGSSIGCAPFCVWIACPRPPIVLIVSPLQRRRPPNCSRWNSR